MASRSKIFNLYNPSYDFESHKREDAFDEVSIENVVNHESHVITNMTNQNATSISFSPIIWGYFSSWMKVKRVDAWIITLNNSTKSHWIKWKKSYQTVNGRFIL